MIAKSKRAQAGSVVGFILFLIMILGVGIPLSQSVIATSNLTGIASTVVSFIPVFLALGAMVAAVATSGFKR